MISVNTINCLVFTKPFNDININGQILPLKMQTKNKKTDYKKLYNKACEIFKSTKDFGCGPYDERFFTLRVYIEALRLISKIKDTVDKEAVLTACLLHDIGKSRLNSKKMFGKNGHLKHANKEWYKHAKKSVPIARNMLFRLGYKKEFTDKICYLISMHDSRNIPNKEKSLELKILQDADLIADVGISGFIRPYLYSGRYNRSIIGAIKYQKRFDYNKDPKYKINLLISKKILNKKLKQQKDMINLIHKEIKCDLL